MFLDPEPKGAKKAMLPSPYLPAQHSTEALGDQRWRIKRKPVQKPPQSQNDNTTHVPDNASDQTGSTLEEPSSTVRLVKPSQSLPPPSIASSQHGQSSSTLSSDHAEDSDGSLMAETVKIQRYSAAPPRLFSSSPLVQETSASETSLQGSLNPNQVSHPYVPANEVRKLQLPPSIALLPKSSNHAVPKTQWHRRSGSAGNYYSSSSTLNEGEFSNVDRERGSARFSSGTTLRGTPTPTESDYRKRVKGEENDLHSPTHALHTLEETSPERATIRAVPPSDESLSSTEDQLESGPSERSLPRPHTSPRGSESEQPPSTTLPRRPSLLKALADSIPAPLRLRKVSSAPAPRQQSSAESFAQSEASLPEPSSPIYVVYGSNDPGAQSSSQLLDFTSSIESIRSRLQYPTAARPHTDHPSLANSSSWSSFQPSSSEDTLPPLQVIKKRPSHHTSKSKSQGPSAGAQSDSSKMESDEEIDTLPYPRDRFSTQLSTIMSESDWRSRSTSQHFSHFSLGSGILTGDDASSIPLPGTRGRGRRQSAPIESMMSESSLGAPRTSSEEGPGDMTLDMYREESAKPQPLFKATGYDGPLPPLPPIPRSRGSDENFDTVSELQTPSLKTKRSGYSLRQRSNSTPSRHNTHSRHMSAVSYVDSDRGSHGSNVFPIWVRHFYGGTTQLLSSSKISLSSHRPPPLPQHLRSQSQWTERSVTSRLGTGYSEIDTCSPTSSRFLPSIFRPVTRQRGDPIARSKRSRPSRDTESRPDSLAIAPLPLPLPEQYTNGEPSPEETLPSGQPKWGGLNDEEQYHQYQHHHDQEPSSASRPPLPRQYSKQRQWNTMQFPRPMTKDHLSTFYPISNTNNNGNENENENGNGGPAARLAPTHRTNRLSAWRPPSFSDSLDTLVRSRCNRQLCLFALGFVCPLLWMVAAVLPLPRKPSDSRLLEKSLRGGGDMEKTPGFGGGSEEDVAAAMMRHEAGDAGRRWREEKQWLKARWWRALNRVMSVVGILVIAAVIALAVVATT
ncbi:hypothetical protein B0A50_06895 [Salinomyces thailandicus]|uniref:Serine-rich protein n=3 Tax=Salinomyces thailandicus TaxID=706561 RepID=A0A4U0TPN0_9PEZI|nr:hypothetical protein B0A50_06895 [Salinomyces thailandica]